LNIFFLDNDPEKCAREHVDKHVIKMCVEYTQLLSTAHRLLDGTQTNALSKTGRRVARWKLSDERDTRIYTATHVNHPSAVWARKSADNYRWLQSLLAMLCKEYTYRYGKIHSCESSGLVGYLEQVPDNIPKEILSPVLLAMDDVYKKPDPVEAYRNYYKYGKPHLHSWKGKINGRPVPEWIQ
jgi:hypothetical protein